VDGTNGEVKVEEAVLKSRSRPATPATPSLEERLRLRFGLTVEEAPEWLREPKPTGKLKPGCASFDLAMMERNFLIGVCRAYCQRKGEKRIENHQMLDRIDRLLAFKESLEFNAMIGDFKDQMTREWEGQRWRYNRWRDYKAGRPVKVDAALEGEDGVKTIIEPFDPRSPAPQKPSLQMPKLDDDEEGGPVRTFHIPPRLVIFIEKALKVMDWPTFWGDWPVKLCKKFNVAAADQKDEPDEEEQETDAAQAEVEAE
jgi:hypothetical protein